MSDKTTTSFEKMGSVNAHANSNSSQSPNLKYAPRGGSKSDAPVGGTGHRQGIQERLGAQYAPQMTMSSPNSPEASSVGRNVRILNSAVGNRDFYLRRQYGQNS